MVDWQDRVDAVWSDAALTDAARIAAIDALASERPTHDARALFERAGARDAAGDECAAESLYRAALASGLTGAARTQALIQLASTVRNLDRPDESLSLLREAADVDDGTLADAIDAFAALAHFSAGEPAAALAVALRRLAPTLSMYGHSIAAYADDVAPASD